MNKKKVFALRLNPEVLEALERWASDEFRSVNGQIEWLIARALHDAGRSKALPDASSSGSKTDKE